MKRIIMIVVLVVSLSSCALDVSNEMSQDDIFSSKLGFDLFYHSDFEDLDNPMQVHHYILNNFTYKSDDQSKDVWSSPSDTFSRGYGDCEDLAILYINMMYFVDNEMCELVLIDNSRTIEEGGFVNHAIVRRDTGILFDPIGASVFGATVKYSYSFNEVFNL